MERLGVELRAEVHGDCLSGHAATFTHLARIKSGYEGLARTAFDACLRSDDVPALINHDPATVLGRTGAGTLKLAVDDSGLYFEIPKLPNTTYAGDLRESVARGDITGASFGFIAGQDKRHRAPDGRQVRMHTTLKRLLDVSPATYPVYDGTDVMVRAELLDLTPDRSLREQILRLEAPYLLRS